LNPPVEGYPYYEGAGTFESGASSWSVRNAWLLAETSLLAYVPSDQVSNLFPSPDLAALRGFQFQSVGESPDSGCFLLYDDSSVIVAFRGTRVPGLQDPSSFLHSLSPSLGDVVTDVRFPAADFLDARVHGGFLDAYLSVAEGLPGTIQSLQPSKPRAVWFTGHSLGGALATLAAAVFGEYQGLYTFGCPRVGDAAFAAMFEGKQSYRVVHHDDVVSRLPPPFALPPLPLMRYTHAGSFVYLDRKGRLVLDADPDRLTDIFAGMIDWQDVFQSALQGVAGLGRFFNGGLPTHVLDVPVPASGVTDHAPVYYAMFLKEAVG
jgi:hypothetical protein